MNATSALPQSEGVLFSEIADMANALEGVLCVLGQSSIDLAPALQTAAGCLSRCIGCVAEMAAGGNNLAIREGGPEVWLLSPLAQAELMARREARMQEGGAQ